MHAAKHRPLTDVLLVLLMVCWIGAGKRWSWVIAFYKRITQPQSLAVFTDRLLRNILAALQELALQKKSKMTEKERV
ncbi:MAG TPA: hypothetical protein VJW20_04410 [Candidatus Angelobacter sp.]|nr:hypothetical protein [Candidatus Angelobacter sp.]